MLKIIKKKINLIFLILAIILSLPALMGLLHGGFPLTDDGNWMVIRFSAFYESLRDGQFPVRFLMRLNNGFGYPVADFLYPLFMYIGIPIKLIGFNFVTTIKIILIATLLSSSLFTFFWLRKMFDNIASLLGAIFYTYFPYHLYDIYKRGSVGEALSLAILPFILWQIERKSLILTTIGLSLLIIAHNSLALLFLPLVILYGYMRNKNNLKFVAIATALALGLSAFFWIPALYDTQYTVFSNTSVSNFYSYFVNIESFNLLGITTIVVLIVSLIVLFLRKNVRENRIFGLSFIFSLLILFLITPISKDVWGFIPLTNLIQFPFRIISILIILLVFQVSYIVNLLKNYRKNLAAAAFLVIIAISAIPYLYPSSYLYFEDSFYSTNQDTTTVKNEYMPKWVKVIPLEMYKSKVEVLDGKEIPEILVKKTNKTSFNILLEKSRIIQVNTVYFPGWEAFVNGVKKDIAYDNPSGLIRLNLDKGQNNVEIIFGETPIRLFSDFISIISLSCLFIFYYLLRKKAFKL